MASEEYDIDLPCKVCDRGVLFHHTTFRMSPPVVFVGYVLLVPSLLGLFFSALLFIGSFVAREPGSGILGVVIGGGLAFLLAVASMVFGLLGWLLVMKKRVLQCDICGAVINAS